MSGAGLSGSRGEEKKNDIIRTIGTHPSAGHSLYIVYRALDHQPSVGHSVTPLPSCRTISTRPSGHSVEDFILMTIARKLGLPPSTGLLVFDTTQKILG